MGPCDAPNAGALKNDAFRYDWYTGGGPAFHDAGPVKAGR